MALRMFARPMSRYSARVLKTAPSQWVCGMTQNVPFATGAFGSSPRERPARKIVANEASRKARGRMVVTTGWLEGCRGIATGRVRRGASNLQGPTDRFHSPRLRRPRAPDSVDAKICAGSTNDWGATDRIPLADPR
jgi:hypothetical protein